MVPRMEWIIMVISVTKFHGISIVNSRLRIASSLSSDSRTCHLSNWYNWLNISADNTFANCFSSVSLLFPLLEFGFFLSMTHNSSMIGFFFF